MKIFQILFLIVLIVPFVEIFLLVEIGAIIGPVPTVLLVVSTAVLGTWLLRRQGLETFQRFQASLNNGEIPAYEMIEGPIILVGGALLLTPGFLTDALGFICLIPSLRRKIAQFVIEKFLLKNNAFNSARTHNDTFIDGEYRKND